MTKAIFITISILSLGMRNVPFTDTCDIAEVYTSYMPKSGTLSINSLGGIEEVRKLLVPSTLDEGKYTVTLSSEGDDIYKINGKDIYFKTRYCMPPTGTEVILVWKSNYGYTKGTIISTD